MQTFDPEKKYAKKEPKPNVLKKSFFGSIFSFFSEDKNVAKLNESKL